MLEKPSLDGIAERRTTDSLAVNSSNTNADLDGRVNYLPLGVVKLHHYTQTIICIFI